MDRWNGDRYCERMVTLMCLSAEVPAESVFKPDPVEMVCCGSEWLVYGDLIDADGCVVEWHAWVTA